MSKPAAASKKPFEFIFELIGWIQIALSPFLIGLIIGAVIYLNRRDGTGLLIGVAVAVLGLLIGIIWATRAWRGKGTIHLVSRVMASPELDTPDEPPATDGFL